MAQPTVPTGNDLAAALGRVPSGLFVLTAHWRNRDAGMLVSWVQQAGFEPPCVTAALRRDRYLADCVGQSGRFALCQLATGQKSLVRHFARGFEPEEDGFQDLPVERLASGCLILRESLAYLDAVVVDQADSGDHRIFIGRVEAGGLLEADGEPAVHVRRNGLRY